MKALTICGIATLLFISLISCSPVAEVAIESPDEILYRRAQDAVEHKKSDVACLTLQTLINTYPESEDVRPAKALQGQLWCDNQHGETWQSQRVVFFPGR
jgi:outer membrane protein assembly factor BamD (BamD/ComL family)